MTKEKERFIFHYKDTMNWWIWTPIQDWYCGWSLPLLCKMITLDNSLNQPTLHTCTTLEKPQMLPQTQDMNEIKVLKRVNHTGPQTKPLHHHAYWETQHQQWHVNSILTDYEQLMNTDLHRVEESTDQWGNSPLMLLVKGLWVHTCSGALLLNFQQQDADG